MPRNGSGQYSFPATTWDPAVNGVTATTVDWNTREADVAAALTASVSKDGQTAMTGNLPMGNNRVTGMAAAIALTDAANANDVQSGRFAYLTGTAGTNTITASLTGLTAYTTGQLFSFVAAGANTGAATLNVNTVGAKAITKNGTIPLAAGDLPANAVCQVLYDGTQFQLVNRQFPGTVIDRTYAEYLLNANIATIIPFDDTIPQNTEGVQIISVAFTPKSATNRLRLRFQGEVAASAVPLNVAAAIFSSASANALTASYTTCTTIDEGKSIVTEVEYVPGVTTALTFTVRVGPQSATNIRMNGNTASRIFGGVSRATLVVEEIAI